MNGRRSYFTDHTFRIMSNVLPAKFNMVKDKNTNGYKLVNNMYGVEIDLLYTYVDQARHLTRLDWFDFGQDFDLSEVRLRDVAVGDYVYGDGEPVKITNKYEFDEGRPTRLEPFGTLTISGVNYGPVGLEYLRVDPYGSGVFMINLDVDGAEAYHGGSYQTLQFNVDSLGNLQYPPATGYWLGISNQEYDVKQFDEVLYPPTERELRDKYPEYREIWASGTNGRFSIYQIEHIEPYDGYYWDAEQETYVAIGYNTQFYYDEETGDRIYHRTVLNNPYGSGNYTTVYMELDHIPISGSLKVYDINNLTPSGLAWEIPQSGIQSYSFIADYSDSYSGVIQYIGYENQVPPEYLPVHFSGDLDASEYRLTSWDYCRASGGIEHFVWVEYPENPITSRIKITNPISKYLVTYKYKVFDTARFVSTVNSTKYIRLDDGNYIYTVDGAEQNSINVPFRMSKDPRGVKKAVTFDGIKYRPGTIIDRLEIDADRSTLEDDIRSNVTLSLDKTPAGYSPSFIPNLIDHRIYYINEFFDGTHGFVPYNTGGSTYQVPFGNNIGTRLIQSSGVLGFYSGVYLAPEPNFADSNNRYLRTRFSFKNPPSTSMVLWQSSDGTEEYWKVTLTADGDIIIQDHLSYLTGSNAVLTTNEVQEIVIERDIRFDQNITNREYSLYHKSENNVLVKKDLWRRFDSSSAPASGSWAWYNSNVDIQLFQVYDESRSYTEI